MSVTSRGTATFWRLYHALPPETKSVARKAWLKFQHDPKHPGLQLERLEFDSRTWSVRVTLNHRAVALRDGDTWLWIGTHRDFDRQFPR